MRIKRIIFGIVLLMLHSAFGCNRGNSETQTNTELQGHNVLLISVDTTRADRIGCYGYEPASTPAIDALAARGTLFEQAYSQVPLTLPSHASIMTGRYPRELGIRVNDKNRLSHSHPTLAGEFKKQGYRTGAFVATFVLDSQFGLDHGFDVYDDDMGAQSPDEEKLHQERLADVVTDSALEWLTAEAGEPFFAWVHYYDPHDPYQPPSAFQNSFPTPYDGEIAFMDTQIGRLLDWLKSAGKAKTTLVVLVGDHGESFGEHVERGHTNFVYETNMHVPLVFAHPLAAAYGKRISATVEIAGIMPTILDLFGWPNPDGLNSTSLADAVAGRPIESMECYSESNAVYSAYQWAEQRSFTTPKWKYISTTKPELYDRTKDSGETNNVISEYPKVSKRIDNKLRARYEEMKPLETALSKLDAEAVKRLRELGYASGGSASTKDNFLTSGLPDPKDMHHIVAKMNDARKHISAEDYARAIPLLESAAKESPGSFFFHYMLGTSYVAEGNHTKALDELKKAAAIDPEYGPIYVSIGDAYMALDQLKNAEENYALALMIDATDAELFVKLGSLFARNGDENKALRYFDEALRVDPDLAGAYFEMGVIKAERGDLTQAIVDYKKAVELDASSVEARYNLGVALLRLGSFKESVVHLKETVKLKSDHGMALNNLGIAYARLGQTTDAEASFHLAMNVQDSAAEAHYNFAIAKVEQGQGADAATHFQKALNLNPTYDKAALKLVGLYLANGMVSESLRVLRMVVPDMPKNASLANTLADILATSRDDSVRNGIEALRFAEQANTLTGGENARVLQTLAAAQAEVGDFDRAVITAKKALELTSRANQPELANLIRSQIAGFQEETPYRNPRY